MYWFKMVYEMDSYNYYVTDSFDINCNVPENTPCLRSRCECDKELARTLYEIAGFPTPRIVPGYGPLPNPIEMVLRGLVTNEDGTGFNPKTADQCKGEPVQPPKGGSGGSNPCANGGCAGGSHTTACCGTYPNRFSYSTKTHECCSDWLFVDIAEIGQC